MQRSCVELHCLTLVLMRKTDRFYALRTKIIKISNLKKLIISCSVTALACGKIWIEAVETKKNHLHLGKNAQKTTVIKIEITMDILVWLGLMAVLIEILCYILYCCYRDSTKWIWIITVFLWFDGLVIVDLTKCSTIWLASIYS